MNKHQADKAVPDHWYDTLNERCDLDQSFESLAGWDHFHTDTLRGRLRYLQLRPGEGWEHFDRALARAETFEGSLRNLLRRFYLKVYRFENALLDESLPQGGDSTRTEACLQQIVQGETPDSDGVRRVRIITIGTYLLHKQSYAAAKSLILRIISDRKTPGGEKTGLYLAAAAAHRGLGELADADRQLENACLAIPTLDSPINMGLYSSIVHAFLQMWGRDQEAVEWAEFLTHLKIPPKTIELFLERSRRIVERSSNLQRIFMF